MSSPVQPDVTAVAPPRERSVFERVWERVQLARAQNLDPAKIDAYVAQYTPFESAAALKAAMGARGGVDVAGTAMTLGWGPYAAGAVRAAVKDPAARAKLAQAFALALSPHLGGAAAAAVPGAEAVASPAFQRAAQGVQNRASAFSAAHPVLAPAIRLAASAAPFVATTGLAAPVSMGQAVAQNAAIGMLSAPPPGPIAPGAELARRGLETAGGGLLGAIAHLPTLIQPGANAARQGMKAMETSSFLTPEQLRVAKQGMQVGEPLRGAPALEAGHRLMGANAIADEAGNLYPSLPVDWTPQMRELGRFAANTSTDVWARYGQTLGRARNPEATAAKELLRRAGSQLDAVVSRAPALPRHVPKLDDTAADILTTARSSPDVVPAALRRAAEEAQGTHTPAAYTRLELTLRRLINSRWRAMESLSPPADLTPEVHIDPLRMWQTTLRGELERRVPGYERQMAAYSQAAQRSEAAAQAVKDTKTLFTGSQTHRLDQGLSPVQEVTRAATFSPRHGVLAGLRSMIPFARNYNEQVAKHLRAVFEPTTPEALRAAWIRARTPFPGFRSAAGAGASFGHGLLNSLLANDSLP